MGMFDDLIPAQPPAASQAQPTPGMFDDLIPAKPQGQDVPDGDGFSTYGQSSLAKDPNEGAHDAALVANGASLGLGPRIAAAGDTAVNAARNWLGYGPMDGTSPDYAGNLDRYNDLVNGARAAHPVAAPVLEGAGGLLIPMGAAGSALQAPSLAGKIASGAALGGGVGAIQGAANAPDWTDEQGTAASVEHGAEVGAGLGAGLPALGAALGAGYQAGAAALAPGLPGFGRAASGIVQGLVSPRAIAKLDQLGPNAMLADGSPSLAGLAGGVVTKPGPGGDLLNDALAARQAGQSDRLMADRNAALGPAVSPLDFKAGIDARQAATGPMFEQAISGMGPLDISPVVAQIGQRMSTAVGPQRNALNDLRGMLMQDTVPAAGGPPVPAPISDPRMIQNAKQAIDNEIDYSGSPFAQPSSAARAAQNAYKAARGGLNDVLETASPDYAAANRAYAAAAQDQRAFDTGRASLGNADEWPQDLQFRYGALPPAQQGAEQAGVRSSIEQSFGTNRNDLSALAKLLGDGNDFNRAKVGTYFGNDAQSALIDALGRERTFADTANKVSQNSQSAQRLGASKLIEDTAKPSEPMFPKDATLTGITTNLGETAVRKVAGAFASASSASTREQLGRLLSLSGPELQDLVAAAQARATAPSGNAQALAKLLAAPATTRALLAGRQGLQ